MPSTGGGGGIQPSGGGGGICPSLNSGGFGGFFLPNRPFFSFGGGIIMPSWGGICPSFITGQSAGIGCAGGTTSVTTGVSDVGGVGGVVWAKAFENMAVVVNAASNKMPEVCFFIISLNLFEMITGGKVPSANKLSHEISRFPN